MSYYYFTSLLHLSMLLCTLCTYYQRPLALENTFYGWKLFFAMSLFIIKKIKNALKLQPDTIQGDKSTSYRVEWISFPTHPNIKVPAKANIQRWLSEDTCGIRNWPMQKRNKDFDPIFVPLLARPYFFSPLLVVIIKTEWIGV